MSIFKQSESYRPFVYQFAVDAEQEHRISMHWHENQVELADDLRQYNSKDGMQTENVSHENNKLILDRLLLLFTEMDANVGQGYTKLLPHVGNNEIRTMMLTFAAREITHQRAYALAAETFGYTNSQWRGFQEYDEMMDKIDLLTQDVGDLSKPINFAKYLAVVFMGEGISLFGAFACLLNLKRYGLMMNFNVVNEWSLSDEAKHVEYNMRVFEEVRKADLTEDENKELNEFVVQLVSNYVNAEHRFLDLVFEMSNQEGMTIEDAKDYISYLGSLRLAQVGLMDWEEVPENTLPWIDYILTGSKHTNFFENKVVDYSHNGLAGSVDYSQFKDILEDRVLDK